MTIQLHSSLEAMLASVDTLCVLIAKPGWTDLHADLLAGLIPAGTLPTPEELASGRNGGQILYGQSAGRRIRIIIQSEGEVLTEASCYALGKKLGVRARQENGTTSGLYIAHVNDPDLITSAVAGWTAGHYDIGLFKKNENRIPADQLVIHALLPGTVDPRIGYNGLYLGQVQHAAMTLVNLPASHKSPEYLGHWAERSAEAYGYTCEVLDKSDLERIGMRALLAVNRGSELPARCIITRYRHPQSTRKVALVGKGVLFDTGGLSIKDSKNMHYMKSDMAGAAAALCTVEACARLGLPVDVMAVVPTTDNSVDALSTKPGDVITAYSGKTIEIIDTDAEGRLVLADALAYTIERESPDMIVDLATLTGSIVAALGPHAAGLFTKSESLAADLLAAGTATGERVWRMPMFDEYAEDMQSDIADIRNLSDKPYAGSITAAKFLEAFTADHPAWAHLDIAGMAFQPNGFGKGYCATGYGVRLLVKWLSAQA